MLVLLNLHQHNPKRINRHIWPVFPWKNWQVNVRYSRIKYCLISILCFFLNYEICVLIVVIGLLLARPSKKIALILHNKYWRRILVLLSTVKFQSMTGFRQHWWCPIDISTSGWSSSLDMGATVFLGMWNLCLAFFSSYRFSKYLQTFLTAFCT